MSEQELQRVTVVSEVLGDRRTVVSAARVLGLSVRQVHRLVKAYSLGGAVGFHFEMRQPGLFRWLESGGRGWSEAIGS
jgi:hypothetical protein